MVAPEKVQLGLRINDYDDWEIQGYSFLENKQVGMTEYVRTDAFIEKACAFLKDRIAHDSIDYPMATNSLIEDFKKYMEE